MRTHEVQPGKDHRGADLISDELPFGRLWYAGPELVAYAIRLGKHRSRSDNAVIRVFIGAGEVIEAHERTGDFKQ